MLILRIAGGIISFGIAYLLLAQYVITKGEYRAPTEQEEKAMFNTLKWVLLIAFLGFVAAVGLDAFGIIDFGAN
jgi:hypothetical protein